MTQVCLVTVDIFYNNDCQVKYLYQVLRVLHFVIAFIN